MPILLILYGAPRLLLSHPFDVYFEVYVGSVEEENLLGEGKRLAQLVYGTIESHYCLIIIMNTYIYQISEIRGRLRSSTRANGIFEPIA